MSMIACVKDIENYACKVLPKNALDYYRSGSGSEVTLKNTKAAFSKLRVRPKMLRNTSNRSLSTVVFGAEVAFPIGISPTAMQRMAHPDGECANAKAAQEMRTVFILSTISTSSIEEVAAAAPNAIKWFQVYIYRDREATKNLIKRAEKAGFKAIVLTVDAPIFGKRLADVRNKFHLPPHLKLANFDGSKATGLSSFNEHDGSNLSMYVQKLFDKTLQWEDVKWLQQITTLPIVLKGVLIAEDAIKAADLGVAGIMVSNHGGRQLDSTPASIEALPEIVKAVGHRMEVFVDGGFQEGIDIFKGLALGAKMVFFGRPALWGLAYDGKEGVKKVLTILRDELYEVLGLSGCCSIEEINADMVVHESFYSRL